MTLGRFRIPAGREPAPAAIRGAGPPKMERETGFEPATLSLEG